MSENSAGSRFNLLLSCVDTIRSFDSQSGGSGISVDKCPDIYEYSKPERAALPDSMTDESINFKAYLNIRSKRLLLIFP